MTPTTHPSVSRRGWLRILTLSAVTACSAMAGSAAATAATTFNGSCQLSGSVMFAPPMTNTPQNGSVYGSAKGSCMGSLTDARGHMRSVDGQTVRARVHSQGTESCEAGSATGAGYLAFGGRRLYFTYSEVRTGPAFVFRVAGARGGSAVAQGNVSPSANPVTILQACGSTGLTGAPVDIRLATTPTISG